MLPCVHLAARRAQAKKIVIVAIVPQQTRGDVHGDAPGLVADEEVRRRVAASASTERSELLRKWRWSLKLSDTSAPRFMEKPQGISGTISGERRRIQASEVSAMRAGRSTKYQEAAAATSNVAMYAADICAGDICGSRKKRT
jgi:hypothetical protein